jgi:hypothetical protein
MAIVDKYVRVWNAVDVVLEAQDISNFEPLLSLLSRNPHFLISGNAKRNLLVIYMSLDPKLHLATLTAVVLGGRGRVEDVVNLDR